MMRKPSIISRNKPIDLQTARWPFGRIWWWRAFVAMLMGLCLLTAGTVFLLPSALIAKSRVVPSDVIVDLAANPHSASDTYVAQLYRTGIAPRILLVSSPIAPDVYPAEYVRTHLVELGVPASAIAELRLPLADCAAQNLPALVRHIKEKGWHRALLVVNPLDSRLGQSVMERYFGKGSVQFTMTYPQEDREKFAAGWWKTHWKAQAIIMVLFGYALDQLFPECR